MSTATDLERRTPSRTHPSNRRSRVQRPAHQGSRPAATRLDAAPAHPSAARRTAPAPPVPNVRSANLKRLVVCTDILAIALGIAGAFVVQALVRPVVPDVREAQALIVLVSLPGWWLGLVSTRLYTARANERPADEARHVVTAATIGTATMLATGFLLDVDRLSRGWVLATYALTTAALLIGRALLRRRFTRLRRERQVARRVVIVGTDQSALDLASSFERTPQAGYEVAGFVGEAGPGARPHVLGGLVDLERVLAEQHATGVVVSLASVDCLVVNRLTRRLTEAGYHVALSSGLCDIDATRLLPQQVDGRSMLYVEPIIRHGWRRYIKRAFDVTVASAALTVSAPVIAVAMVLIRIESRGPILFRQQRVGLAGEPFDMIKLRTMVPDAEQRRRELLELNESDGPLFKIKSDPRITRVGRVLRRFSIDELPQFWNVLRGDMSVVGPRPALPEEMAEWPADLRERTRVLPGITGLWQVSGRAETSFDDYARLDLYYVDNWSLQHDWRIVRKTFGAVLRGSGAS
jgi:exopolysaccharide biosynthesis polyprenyl glycosylphosphotransferase